LPLHLINPSFHSIINPIFPSPLIIMETTLKDYIATHPKPLVTTCMDDIVETVLMKMEKERITAVPLLHEGKLIGFVDNLDLLSFLVQVSSKNLFDVSTGDSANLTTDDLRMIMKRQREFRLSHVKDVIDLAKRITFTTMPDTRTLKEALVPILKGAHRVAVVSSTDPKKLVGVISQTDYAHFIMKDFINIYQAKEIEMRNCKNITTELVSISSTAPTINAFLKMHKKGLSSIAITKGSELVGTLSASDLKYTRISTEFLRLLEPVLQFTNAIRSVQGKPADYLVAVPPGHRIIDVLQIMNKERVHRIFVVDPVNKKILGVMSLTDILREIFPTVQGAQ